MLKSQRGQAFILVLILLAVGALLITPALNLTFTGLKSRMIHHTDLMEQYAADGAQEYSMWLLTDPIFVADLIASGGSESGLYIVLNGVQAEYTITYQASEGPPSDAPITDDRYKITVGVTPSSMPLDVTTEFTYSITLQYMYPDVPTKPLAQLEVQIGSASKTAFNYIGPTSGFTTLTPTTKSLPFSFTLTWDFTSQPISFDFFEKKSMSFRATAKLPEGTYYTAATARVADGVSGSSGPTAPIIVGSPAETGIPRLDVTKTVFPIVIPPGVSVNLTYTIRMENLSTVEDIPVLYVEDTLPAGFSYAGGDTGFLTLCDGGEPSGSYVAGGTREQWQWKFAIVTLTVPDGETLIGSFEAIGWVDSSGTYANEVFIKALADVGDAYSWPTGGVIVPQFDIVSSSGGTTLKVVTEVSGGSHNIKSWQVE